MDEILTEIRRYNRLKMIIDDEIIPYIKMADFEIAKFSVDAKKPAKSKSVLYISPFRSKALAKNPATSKRIRRKFRYF